MDVISDECERSAEIEVCKHRENVIANHQKESMLKTYLVCKQMQLLMCIYIHRYIYKCMCMYLWKEIRLRKQLHRDQDPK